MRRVVFFLVVVILSGSVGGCVALESVDRPSLKFKTPTELYNRALTLYQSGKYKDAQPLFQEYIGQYPDSLLFKVALYYLGHCYQKSGDTKEALTLYNRIIHTWGDEDFWGEQAMKRVRQIESER